MLAIGAGLGIVFFFGIQPMPAPPTTLGSVAMTRASTLPASSMASTAPSLQTYGQLLHADFSNYPETRPYSVPVDLSDAAHLILREPIYVCSRGDLWITRSGADALPVVLARAAGESEHLVDRPIEFVVWSLNRRGAWESSAVCRDDGGFEIVSAKGVQRIPWHRSYRWDMAMTWDDGAVTRIIVPTDDGVSLIALGDKLTEDYCRLTDAAATTRPRSAPAVLFDTRGLLAWIPADEHFSQTRVARYLNGQWTYLDSANWPGDIVYLVPLLDGSVLQIRHETGENALTFVTLDNPDIAEKDISSLVDQLGDDDPDKRASAYQRLAQYGPKINPVLEKLVDGAAPQSQARIHELLRGTTLGGMAINGNQLIVKARLRDGGMIFMAPQGVTVPQEGGDPKVVVPDYLAVRPGRPVQELPPAVVAALTKSNGTAAGFGDEWVVDQADAGPQRFLPPDELDPLLKPEERNFSRMMAIDGRGRWLFRDDSSARTLVLDPTVPDPRPRLAIWMIDMGSSVGWNKTDWPVIKRGDSRWIIDEHDWEPMDAAETMIDQFPLVLYSPAPANLVAATAPTTADDSAARNGPLLLVDSDGTRYFDGQLTLTVVTATGKRRVWSLPDQCAGSSDETAYLVADHQGHLFLFNSVGRIARLRITPGDAQPLQLESVFGDHIPDFHSIQRVWCDPAGRIIVAYDTSHLAMIFPSGQVPHEIGEKILPQDLRRIDAP